LSPQAKRFLEILREVFANRYEADKVQVAAEDWEGSY
jgi:hypothetical protein